MKKAFCMLLSVILCIACIPCFAEEIVEYLDLDEFEPDIPIPKLEELKYYIIRPNVKCRSLENDEEFVTLHFGEEVKILERNDEYTCIEYGEGQKGKVTTGFIIATEYPILYLSSIGVYLSPISGLKPTDLGYGAGGLRWEERAIVLYAEDEYLYIVTEEGFSGFTNALSPEISLFIE